MAYVDESFMGSIIPKSTAVFTAEDLNASPAVYGGFLVMKQCKIKAIKFYVTTAINTVTAPAVEFNRRPTYNSASGEVLLGTLTIPNGTAAGKVIVKEIDPVVLFPGEELSLEHTVQAGTAGAGFYGFEIMDDPEEIANQSNVIESA